MNKWTLNAIVVIVGIAAGLLVTALFSYQWTYDRYSNALRQLEPRIERLKGLMDSSDEIKSTSVIAQGVFDKWGHPFSEGVQNDIQRSVRQIIEASGMNIVANQAAYELSAGHQIGMVHANITVTGDWAAALKLFEALQNQIPPIIVKSVVLMRENGAATAEPQLIRASLQLDAPVLAKEMP